MTQEDIKQMLLVNHNIILHGAPGTGKTYLAQKIAEELGATKENGQFKMVQFHPSYDYTDFVEGLRPTDKGENDKKLDAIYFNRKNGVFKEFCKSALACVVKPHNTVISRTALYSAWASLWDDIRNNRVKELPNKERGTTLPLCVDKHRKDKIKFTRRDKQVSENHWATFDGIMKIHDEFGSPSLINHVGDILKVCKGSQTSTLWAIYNEVYNRALAPLASSNVKVVTTEELKTEWGELITDILGRKVTTIEKKDGSLTPTLNIGEFEKDSAQHDNKRGDKRIEWEVKNQYCSWGYIVKIHEQCKSPNAENIYEIIQGIAKGAQYTIIWAIYNMLYNRVTEKSGFASEGITPYSEIQPRYYIFLIDEINRGDMSKIFGELFYAIDPGYRGEKGKIDTQYQNLIDKEGDDPFKEGFYVPDNVYIIGTMNDIDRSVDSMDFAMRRRFQFIEVTAEDSAKNMRFDENSIAFQRMKSLNECIVSEKIKLDKSFQIGGAYFLGNEKDCNGNKLPIKDNDYTAFEDLWKYRLEGLLREYLRGDEEKVIKDKLDILYNAYKGEDDHEK